ncbi:MAG: DNA recombination protein RmuC [Anaerolineales bacterium]|nr:DNA recombination protein RmuC [Anaerolineales bacterium]
MDLWAGFLVGGVCLLLGAVLGYLAAIVRMRSASDRAQIQLAQLQAERRADQEKLAWMQQSESKLREAFDSLASHALQLTSDELLRRARDQSEAVIRQVEGDLALNRSEMHGLVEPLRANLQSLDTHLRELEQKREGAYYGLQEQVRQLASAQTALQTTTLTLAQALKSPSVRGRWGEVTLRRVVELADLVHHVDFEEQFSGDLGRPDMIVYLSNQGVVPVDAKVPLNAYLESIEAVDEETRRSKLIEHARAMKARIRELGQRRYWEQFERTPDFVVMFVPNEACLAAAFENDPALLEDAIQQHVLVASPVTLLALLKAVAYGWQQAQVADNARAIALQGQELYKRLETFVDHLADVGKSLNRAAEAYNQAIGSLERRLLPSARRLQEAGLATSVLEPPAQVEARAGLPSATEEA